MRVIRDNGLDIFIGAVIVFFLGAGTYALALLIANSGGYCS